MVVIPFALVKRLERRKRGIHTLARNMLNNVQ
jgi:hypothetical protein